LLCWLLHNPRPKEHFLPCFLDAKLRSTLETTLINTSNA
jgi:hypothetical protein